MRLTNRMNLPQPIFDAVKNDGYSRGDADISVTGLLRPPRISALSAVHYDYIVEDASDRIWSLVGQVMHGILERAQTEGIAERRLAIEIEGWKVSGGMDAYYDGGLLQDYKFVTAYKFKDGGVPEDYIQQLNCYAEILRGNGIKVTRMEIVGILRDWSKLEARRDPNYPQAGVIIRSVPLWSREEAQRFMRERVILHQQARVTLPECTPEERWAKPSVWALMKHGRKTAVKLYDNQADAEAHASSDPKQLYVVHRPGENVRCQSYCPVASFCSQWAEIQANTQRAKTHKEAS